MDSETIYDDTWTFDGTAWQQLNIVSPPARTGACAATLNGKVVLFGGSGNTSVDGGSGLYNDTWTFDGSAWSQVSTANAPSARGCDGLAPLNGALYLFGGNDETGNLSDTWKFDGATWTQINATGPGAYGETIGSTSSALVLFGGDDSMGNFQSNTWTFDGTSWTIAATTGVSSRVMPAMVQLNGKVLLWGGYESPTTDGMHSFDGKTWSALPATLPSGFTEIFGGGSQAVLGSGIVELDFEGNTWTYDGSAWTQVDFTSHPVTPPAREGGVMASLP